MLPEDDRMIKTCRSVLIVLMGISDFDPTGRLLIIYSAFAKYLRKNGNTMKKFISFL